MINILVVLQKRFTFIVPTNIQCILMLQWVVRGDIKFGGDQNV